MKDAMTVQKAATPIPTVRTARMDRNRVLTSGDAGKVIPLAYAPILREDSVRRGTARFAFEMQETEEMLLNDVYASVHAYFVPYLAFERFSGMDALNRAYEGVKERDADAAPVDFIETNAMPAHGSNEVYKALGLHAKVGDNVNQAILEAYNCMINYRRNMRSKSLTERTRLDGSLAEAFWRHDQMKHIVPDYDAARIDGEVPLNVVEAEMPISMRPTGTRALSIRDKNTGLMEGIDASLSSATLRDTGGGLVANQIFAELQENGITVSLSNIEMAKKTAAFARMRERYGAHDDDYIIDLLMRGIRIPEQQMKDPIHLGSRMVPLEMIQRYATDSANLEKSVVLGKGAVEMTYRLPPVNTGGIILFTVEFVPDQLFERRMDYFFELQAGAGSAAFPDFLADYLDPEKVVTVPNKAVDVDHGTPDGVFGYAPLNHEWHRDYFRVGGKFYRPEVDAGTDTDRQRIWAVETTDPALSDDFYLCTQLHKKIFLDESADGFEIMGITEMQIEGRTVFGEMLTEATGDYDAVLADVDQTRVGDE